MQQPIIIFSALFTVKLIAVLSSAPQKDPTIGIIVCAAPAINIDTNDRHDVHTENAASPSCPASRATIILNIHIFANISP